MSETVIDQIVRSIIEGDDSDFYDDPGFEAKELSHPTQYGEVLDLINRGWIDVSLSVDRTGHHYVHERSTSTNYDISFSDEVDEETAKRIEELIKDMDAWLSDRMVDWNKKIYRELEASYESLFEDDFVADEIIANERTFDEEGNDGEEFTYEQLSPEAQERAREVWKEFRREDPDNWWSEPVIAEWKWLLTNKGFGEIEIAFSGFWSQGDGASFTGRVEDWNKFFNGPDPLEFPEQDREQLTEGLEDDDDLKDLQRSDRKPWGYLLKSKGGYTDKEGKQWPSPYPWLNRRWSNASGCCGNFRRYIGDATVFKRLSAARQYSSLEVVPIYDNPRVYGEKVLDPLFEPKPSHTFRTLRPGEPLGERYGGAEKERALFYHGTSAALIPKIMAEGLIPDPKRRVWSDDPSTSIIQTTRKTVFGIGLTRNFGSAISDGGIAARRDHTDVAIICVVAQPRSLIADEDDVSFAVKAVIPHLADSIYHHIWPYFFEVYRGQYEAGRLAEAMEDEDDMKELASHYVSDYYTEAAEKQKNEWVDNAVKALAHRLRDASPELLDRVRTLLFNEGYRVMLTRAVSYASNNPHNQHEWAAEWGRYFKHQDPPPIPDQQQSEHAWLMFNEKLARTLKDYARKGRRNKDSTWDISGRATQRIGFHGSNRIVCIIERIDGKKEQDYHSRMLVHYGKPPRKLIEDWNAAINRLGPEDIVYKNSVQEATEDEPALHPNIFVVWAFSHDVNLGWAQNPPLEVGTQYRASRFKEHGPFGDWEQAYEWAKAEFHDCKDKMDTLGLVSIDDGIITASYFITDDWEIKRYGQMPDGSILGEGLDDEDDLKDATQPGQRWLYGISQGREPGQRTVVRYYVTDDPSVGGNRVQLTQHVMGGRAQIAASQTFPRRMPLKEVEQWAQAQIRSFQSHGRFEKNQHMTAWQWMAQQRKPEK